MPRGNETLPSATPQVKSKGFVMFEFLNADLIIPRRSGISPALTFVMGAYLGSPLHSTSITFISTVQYSAMPLMRRAVTRLSKQEPGHLKAQGNLGCPSYEIPLEKQSVSDLPGLPGSAVPLQKAGQGHKHRRESVRHLRRGRSG